MSLIVVSTAFLVLLGVLGVLFVTRLSALSGRVRTLETREGALERERTRGRKAEGSQQQQQQRKQPQGQRTERRSHERPEAKPVARQSDDRDQARAQTEPLKPRQPLKHLRRQPSSWGPVWRRVLLLAVPAAFVANSMHLSPVLVFALACLAVLPLAGFMGKLFIFIAAFKAGLYPLLAIAIVGVVISIYYYFGWIKAAYFETWSAPLLEGETDTRPARTRVGVMAGVTLASLAVATLVLGFYQGALGEWLLSR